MVGKMSLQKKMTVAIARNRNQSKKNSLDLFGNLNLTGVNISLSAVRRRLLAGKKKKAHKETIFDKKHETK